MNYLFQDADVLLVVGANPRYEAPLVNARIRKGYGSNVDCKIRVIKYRLESQQRVILCRGLEMSFKNFHISLGSPENKKNLRFRLQKLPEYLGDKKTLGTESSKITEVDLKESLKKKVLHLNAITLDTCNGINVACSPLDASSSIISTLPWGGHRLC